MIGGDKTRSIDAIISDIDAAKQDVEQLADEEADLIEGIPLPGTPIDELERRKEWLNTKLKLFSKQILINPSGMATISKRVKTLKY